MYPEATIVAGKPVENLDDYALARVAEDVGETDPNRVKTIIMGAFETAFLNYALGDEDADAVAVNHELFARRVWQRYMNEIGRYEKNLVRVGLEELPVLREQVLQGVLSPEYGLDPILAAQLRTRLNLPADYGTASEAPVEEGAPANPGPAGAR
jgi:hypothetical protein